MSGTINIGSTAQWRQVLSANTIVVADCELPSRTRPSAPPTNKPSAVAQSTPTGAAPAR